MKTANMELHRDRDVALRTLKLAEEEKGGLAVRKSDDDPASFATLKASIAAVGILQPLIVTKSTGGYCVVSGNRRLRALRELAAAPEEGDRFDKVPIIEVTDGSSGQLREIAVMANLSLPMHPVDQLEVLAGARKGGMSEDDIAARWGLKPQRVRQLLALGALVPEVRDAWRSGKITAKSAEKFTLADDKLQTAVLAKYLAGKLSDWQLNEALVGKARELGPMLQFVGLERYRQDGGKLREDLFGVLHIPDDPKLVKRLYEDRIEAIIASLIAQGWAWAERKPQNFQWSYGKIDPKEKPKPTKEEKAELEAIGNGNRDDDDDDDDDESDWETRERINGEIALRGYTAEQRKKSGCWVSVTAAGKLTVEPGRVKPEAKRKETATKKAKERAKKVEKAAAAGDLPGVVSNALVQRMSQWLTRAAAAALLAQPRRETALAALVAGVASKSKTCEIAVGGLGRKETDFRKLPTFESIFSISNKKTMLDLLRDVDTIISNALDFEAFNSDHPPLKDPGVVALVNAIDPDHLHRELRKAIDFDDYFASVSKAMIVAALKEIGMDGAEIARLPAAKAELAAFAAKRMKTVDWFPPELRAAGYKGLASKSAKTKGAKR